MKNKEIIAEQELVGHVELSTSMNPSVFNELILSRQNHFFATVNLFRKKCLHTHSLKNAGHVHVHESNSLSLFGILICYISCDVCANSSTFVILHIILGYIHFLSRKKQKECSY